MSPRPSDTLSTGDIAPDFTLPAPDGALVTRSIYQENLPLLLLFFRGTWCTRCRNQIAKLRRDHPTFTEHGVRLLGVAAQKRSRLAAFLAANPLQFPILADEERLVTKAYGVYVGFNLESFRIARPSTFLVDRHGVVRFLHVGTSQFDRPGPAEILRAIDGLTSG
jgi:peroxiredoxin